MGERLTGNYFLKSRCFGGYDVYVEVQDTSLVFNLPIWRKATTEEVVQVMKIKVI